MTQTLTTERLREIVEDGFLEHGGTSYKCHLEGRKI